MKKLGFPNLNDYDIEIKRFINYDNNELNVLHTKKTIKYVEPRPNIFFSPAPDNREKIIIDMKKKLEKDLEIILPKRN